MDIQYILDYLNEGYRIEFRKVNNKYKITVSKHIKDKAIIKFRDLNLGVSFKYDINNELIKSTIDKLVLEIITHED